MRCSERPQRPAAGRAAAAATGFQGRAAQIRGLGPPRGPLGQEGRRAGRFPGAGPRLELGLLWRGGRPGRPSCRAAAPRAPTLSRGRPAKPPAAGGFSVTGARWTTAPGLPDPPRADASGVFGSRWGAGSHSGASASPPASAAARWDPEPAAGVQRLSCRGDHGRRPFRALGLPRAAPPRANPGARTRAPARFRVRGHRHQPAARDGALSAGHTVLVFPPLAGV